MSSGDLKEETMHSADELAAGVLVRTYTRSITLPVIGQIPLNPAEMIADLKMRENPPLWAQVFKYAFFGFVGVAISLGVYALVDLFYGSYLADDLPKEVLKTHLFHVFVAAFILSNTVAYITNRMFVFTPSNRSKSVEFGIFLLVSLVSFYAGNLAKDWFIDAGLHKHIAALAFVFFTALVNFISRKYLVFNS